MAETLTLEDVARLVTALRERPLTEPGEAVYDLKEVAAMTKMSLRALEKDCRSGAVEHVHRGHLRGMTRQQITKLIQRYSEGGDLQAVPSSDAREQAREATRRSGASRARRVA